MFQMTDDEIRAELKAIDESEDVDVTKFEASFIETAVYKWKGPYSERQRQCGLQIIGKYKGKY
jgi:hypothetical protein